MDVGVRCLPILSLITFFIGLILALQVAYELRQFGAMSAVATAVAVSMSRELREHQPLLSGMPPRSSGEPQGTSKILLYGMRIPSASRLGSILQHQRGGLASLGCSHPSGEVSPSCQEPSEDIAGIPSLQAAFRQGRMSIEQVG